MATPTISLPNLVIPSGQTASNAVTNMDDSIAVALFAPAALTGTITVQVEPSSTGTNFVALQSGGVDVTIAASKAIVINPIPFRQLRVLSGSAEGADRTFSCLRTMPT